MRIYGVCKSTTKDSSELSETTRQKMGVLVSSIYLLKSWLHTYLVTYFWCQYSYLTFYMYICCMHMKWEKQTSACECSMTLAASAIESKNRKAPVVALLHYSTPKCQLILDIS